VLSGIREISVAATKVELFERIRRDSWREGLSVRALARKYGVHRRLVREALTRAEPAPRKRPVRQSPQLEPLKEIIDGWLRADLDAPRKQRHTVTRIHARLVAEHGAAGVSYSAVRDYVSRRRPEIAEEEGRDPARVFIPRHHPPGQHAEVDFGEFWVRLAGVMTKCYLFVLRMSYSGKAVHRVFATCGQEAFLEGHVHAFAVLGGVPAGQVRYDNLTAAVWRVLLRGRAREENPRWTAFRSHYRLEAFYCLPGIEGAHEKGGVEGEVGYFRRNYLVPVPEVASLEELNARIAAAEQAEDGRRIGSRIRTIGQDFDSERPLLVPLPDDPFETGLVLTPRVDLRSQIMVRNNRYSVPSRLIGRQVRVVLRSSELVVYYRHAEAARHPRLPAKGGERVVLDHYLEALMRKPGAMPGSAPLDQARADGAFTAAHEAFWSAARRAVGDPAATRELIGVLLLHRHMNDADVIAGIGAALSVGAHSADVVAVEARKVAGARSAGQTAPEQGGEAAQVTSLTLRRIAALPPDTRPLPAVDAYDQLLCRQRPAREGH